MTSTTDKVLNTAEVKEHPILFSAPMVLAILAGKKTQTRRIIKRQPGADIPDRVMRKCKPMRRQRYEFIGYDAHEISIKPYAFVGDRLWVRESLVAKDCAYGRKIAYAADGLFCSKGRIEINTEEFQHYEAADWKWRNDSLPSIHMPRIFSRITLEVTDVRFERVQQISEADALAEGFDKETCAKIFDDAAGAVKYENLYWLENDVTGESEPGSEDYCRKCAEKRRKTLGKKWRICGDGGSATESDGPAMCATCGAPLLMSLTEYGVERELRIEDDPDGKDPKYFPVTGGNARIANMISDGFGDIQEKHLGRLAQIGFATIWNILNGPDSFELNRWVQVVTFQRIEP